MINSYEIKSINGEEILYLYFDFNYEFSKENFNKNKKSIRKIVNNFIKHNKNIFKGTTVLLISGGILFGTIRLNKKNTNTSFTNDNICYEEVVETNKNNNAETYIQEEKNNNESVNTDIEPVNEQKETQVKENKEGINPTVNTTTVEKEEITHQEVSQDVEEEIVDNNIYVNVKRINGSIIKIELEEYVIGVVGAEMPASFNIEALKAQAIIARTYALKKISTNTTLSDNESTQSYKDNNELQSIWGGSYSTYYNKIKSAVMSTKGMYLTYNGTYIEAVYHSTSNTKTESSVNVWGNYYPYLISVDSPYDTSNPSYEKEITKTYNELSSIFGFEVNKETRFNIINYTESGRVGNILVGNKTYTGVQFRNLLGLRSADFEITLTNDYVIFKTRGYGHGVGMSQYGANGMAKDGYSSIDILKHYYRGVSINYTN